jgi:DNA-binding IclR family transcriptional regulator
VVLHIADGLDAQVLEQYAAVKHVVRVEHEIGSRHPLILGASGRALLAHLPPKVVAKVVSRADNPASVERQLDGIRQLGYALSHDELQNGVHGLAVPVLDATGHGVASLAIIVPALRATGLIDYIDVLTEASNEVAALLWNNADD